MSELKTSIKKYLGIRIGEEQIDHYTLLGLKRNAGPNEIKQALRTVVAAWNSSDTKSEPESAQQVAKLIKQAQAVLLDESKKQEYDEQLSRQISPWRHIYLPQADPYAPFDPSACLVGAAMSSAPYSFGSVNDRWNEMSRQIPILAQPSMTPRVSNDYLESDRAHAPKKAPGERTESATTRIEQLRRKRRLQQRMYLAAFATVAVAFLGYAGIRFLWNRQQIAQRHETDGSGELPPAKKVNSKEAMPKTMGGKSAPKSTSKDSAFVLPTLSKDDASVAPGVEPSESNPFGTAPMAPKSDEPPMSGEPANAVEPMKPDMPTPEPLQPDAVKPTPMKPGDEKPVVPEAAKAKWIATMTKAKEAINKADFATFHREIDLARPLASNGDMESKYARLDQLGQLYEIFIKSLHESKSKLQGSETLSVGKMVVAIVEVKEDELIVRINKGKNERYAWDRLPPGIANAMADLSLSDQDPIDLAARAVYFSLSPTRNELYAKKVTDWFDKSVGKGSVRKDLVQALSDTYE